MTTLYAYDLFHAGLFIKVMLFAAYIIPSLITFILIYGIVVSFYSTTQTDQDYFRWGMRVFLVILCVSTLFGGVLGTAAYNRTPDEHSIKGISQLVLYKNPGAGAQRLDLPSYGFGLPNADVYAMDHGIDYASDPNVASLQTVKPSQVQAYVLTAEAAATREDLDFVKAWYALNSRLEGKSFISKPILFVVNMMNHHAFGWAKKYDNDVIAGALGRNGDLNVSEWFGSWHSSDDQAEVYAANGSGPSGRDAYYVATVNTYPGGPSDYMGYMVSRMESVEKVAVANTVSPEKVVARAEGDAEVEASIPKYDRELYERAKERGYTSQVPPEIYVQTHLPAHVEQCNKETFNVEDETSYEESGLAAVLSPCKFVLNRRNSGLSGMLDRDFDLGIRDAFNALIGGNEVVAGLLGRVAQAQDLGLRNFLVNDSSCSNLTSLDSVERVYRRWKRDLARDPRVQANSACVDQGHNLAIALVTIREKAGRAVDLYERYIGGSRGPWALEDEGSYAVVVGGGDGPTSGDALASVNGGPVTPPKWSSIANEAVLEELNPEGLPATVQVRTPTAIANEAQANDSILGEVAAGVSAVGGTATAVVAKAKPGFLSTAWTWVKGTASKGAKAVKKVASKAAGKVATKINPVGWVVDLVKTAFTIIPVVMILTAYTFVYYKTIYSLCFGFVFHVGWAFLQIPQLMTKRDGSVPFPFGQFLAGFVILLVEAVCLVVATGLFMQFIVNFGESFIEALTGSALGLATAISGEFTGKVVGDPMSAFLSALEPLGKIAGLMIIPSLLQVAFLRGYQTTMDGMPISMQQASIAGLGIAAGGSFGGGRGSGNAEPTKSKEDDKPTTFDEAADKAEA